MLLLLLPFIHPFSESPRFPFGVTGLLKPTQLLFRKGRVSDDEAKVCYKEAKSNLSHYSGVTSLCLTSSLLQYILFSLSLFLHSSKWLNSPNRVKETIKSLVYFFLLSCCCDELWNNVFPQFLFFRLPTGLYTSTITWSTRGMWPLQCIITF